MANQAHIDLLLTDVNEWNDWREKNPLIIPDLGGC
jgi:hypothetical protein